jgi:CDGSH-type Zn-finger protein
LDALGYCGSIVVIDWKGGERMSEVKVTAMDNGPLAVSGGIELVDGAGNRIETKETTYLCRCGQSSNKPFCNGAHKAANFQSEVRA